MEGTAASSESFFHTAKMLSFSATPSSELHVKGSFNA